MVHYIGRKNREGEVRVYLKTAKFCHRHPTLRTALIQVCGGALNITPLSVCLVHWGLRQIRWIPGELTFADGGFKTKWHWHILLPAFAITATETLHGSSKSEGLTALDCTELWECLPVFQVTDLNERLLSCKRSNNKTDNALSYRIYCTVFVFMAFKK